MRILVTGLTGAHSGRVVRGGRINCTEAVVSALREAGHEVFWTGYKLNGNLESFDLLWFVISPPRAMGAMSYGAGALSLLGRWRAPYVLQVDDWNIRATVKDVKSLLYADGRALYRTAGSRLFFRSETVEDMQRFHPCVAAGLRRILSYDEPSAYAVLAYAWGDLNLLRSSLPPGAGSLYRIDPSPSVYHVIKQQEVVKKQRRWVLAALASHGRWSNQAQKESNWPWHVLGPASRGGIEETDEFGVYESYRSSWGVASPPYPHAGSGWWRTRFIYSAAAQSILLTERGEADALGGPYRVNLNEVEDMGLGELRDLAESQAQALLPWMISWGDFVDQCDLVCRMREIGL